MTNYELRIETSEMKKALDALSTVIFRKSALPILADALVRYDRERKVFTMTASNGEQFLTLECWRPDENAEKGMRHWLFLDRDDKSLPLDSFCINVNTFREAFAMLPTLPALCYLQMNEAGGSMRVVYGNGEFTLPVNEDGQPEDYPPTPLVVERDGELREGCLPMARMTAEASCLLQQILSASTCAGNSETRPVMNTVCLDLFADYIVIVATDGHSLYRIRLDTGTGYLDYADFSGEGHVQILVPTAALQPLAKAFTQAQKVTLAADNHNVRIVSDNGNASLTSRTIDGKYPNYESVIPRDNPYRLKADKMELQAALRRISLFSVEASNLGILYRSDEKLILKASDDGRGRKGEEGVTIINADECSMPENQQHGCKISVLQKMLGCVATENVIVELSDPTRAIILREDATSSGLTILIMPMLVE